MSRNRSLQESVRNKKKRTLLLWLKKV